MGYLWVTFETTKPVNIAFTGVFVVEVRGIEPLTYNIYQPRKAFNLKVLLPFHFIQMFKKC